MGVSSMTGRKEQVSALACALFNKHTDIDECIAIANKYIQEAEERAQAECAADTRRLEWMVNRSIRIENGFGEPCPRTVLDSCDDILARSVGDFRPAIDAAMESGNG